METIADHGARVTGVPDLDNFPRIPLDMDAITAAAMKRKRWRLEFDCNGQPWEWEGEAATSRDADNLARQALTAAYFPSFLPADARTVVCIEVSA